MLSNCPPRVAPVRTMVLRPTRTAVSAAVNPAMPLPAIRMSQSIIQSPRRQSWTSLCIKLSERISMTCVAHVHSWPAVGYGWYADLTAIESEIELELQVALGLDENDSDVHRILAAVAVVRHDFD